MSVRAEAKWEREINAMSDEELAKRIAYGQLEMSRRYPDLHDEVERRLKGERADPGRE